MKGMTLDEATRLVEGILEGGDPDTPIYGAAPVAEANPGEITFFGNPRYIAAVRKTKATAVLVPADFSEEIKPTRIRVANPSLAFARLAEAFSPEPVRYSAAIHPTAVIAPDAKVAPDASVQPYAVIESGAVVGAGSVIGAHVYVGHESTIGEHCLIYPHVTIRERCIIANRVIIHSGAVLGADGFGFELTDGKYAKIPQTGIVQIDDDVEIGANTTIDRARFGRTWIQEGAKIDNQVMIAHNVVVGAHTVLCGQVGISGSTRVGRYVTMAGQVGVAGHVEIADQVILAAQSGVAKSILQKGAYLGAPAEPMGDAKRRIALTSRRWLERLSNRVKLLEEQIKRLS